MSFVENDAIPVNLEERTAVLLDKGLPFRIPFLPQLLDLCEYLWCRQLPLDLGVIRDAVVAWLACISLAAGRGGLLT